MKRPVFLFALLAVLIFPLTAKAEAPTWQPRYDESTIRFTSTESGRTAEGAFTAFTADIQFSPDDLAASRVDVLIDVRSLERPDKEAESTLRGAEWFDLDNYATARFAADEFEQTGDQDYIAHGTLTIKEISRPLALPFTLAIDGDVARMTGEATLLRLDHAIGTGQWQDTSFIANEVRVGVSLVADRK